MKKKIKYYVCLLAILVAGTSLSRASSGLNTGIAAAPAVVETRHATSLQVAYATGIQAMPSAVYVHAATAPALSSEILTGERDLLFGPSFPLPDTGTGSGGAVGEAPIRDCVWLLMFISLAYMILASGFDKLSHRTIQLLLLFQPGRMSVIPPLGAGGLTLLSEKLPKRESEAIEQVLFGQKPFFCFFFCGHKKRKEIFQVEN